MKKTLLVAALAAVLMFAFAGSAFAAGINHSGQTQVGVQGASGPTSTTVSEANIYYPWDATKIMPSPGNAQTDTALPDFAGNSPHGNFTTSTTKCVVCHAVHYAAPGGAAITSANTQDADTLLRVKASEACIFCHATAGMAVNGRPVYDGLGATLAIAGNTGGATNTGHATGTNCSYCHSSVHGANADSSVASLNGYLLKLMPATDIQGTGAPSANMLAAATALDFNAQNQGFAPGAAVGSIAALAGTNSALVREQAVGIFCAECHLGAYATQAPGAATNIYESNATTASFSGHRIAAAATSTWNTSPTANMSSSTFSGTIAWAAADNCKSCHDAKDIYGNTAFPHSWGGTKMWLKSAATAAAGTSTNLPYGTAADSAYNTGAPQLADGVCLKCHVATGSTAGVGITF